MTEHIEYSIFPVTKPLIELRGCDVSRQLQSGENWAFRGGNGAHIYWFRTTTKIACRS